MSKNRTNRAPRMEQTRVKNSIMVVAENTQPGNTVTIPLEVYAHLIRVSEKYDILKRSWAYEVKEGSSYPSLSREVSKAVFNLSEEETKDAE